MLNRKWADLRHAPELDPRVLAYDPSGRPQAILRLGPRSARKTKGGIVVGEPGWTWVIDLEPGRWWALTSVFDREGALVAHHVDIALPPEERDGVLTFLDLKLDWLLPAGGEPRWLDRDEYDDEIRAGTIVPGWDARVREAVATLEALRARGAFPPAADRLVEPHASAGPHPR